MVQAYKWTVDGSSSKKLYTVYYPSLHDALDAVDEYKDVLFSENAQGQDQSIQGKSTSSMNRGEALPLFIKYCRSYSAPYLAERASTIAQLSEDLQDTGLQAVSMKRHSVWAKQGSRLNPHKVLRGQLSTAWRKTVREHRPANNGRLAIVLNMAVSHTIPTEQILWGTAATLALADSCRRAGHNVDVYGAAHATDLFKNIAAHVVCIPLLRSSDVWSIHNTALSTSEAMFRRLCFRLWEIWQPKLGPIEYGYGYPGQAKQIRIWADNELSKYIGLPSSAIHLGCTQEDNIHDMASAKSWLASKIALIDTE